MKKASIKILSIDGGGIRGVIPCRILSFIEKNIAPRESLAETFDLMVGTSTGGIIVAGLSTLKEGTEYTFTAQEMLELYEQNGKNIFQKRKSSFWERLLSFTPLKTLFQKPYEANIEEVLTQYFGTKRLTDCITKILVTSHDLKSNRPYYFSSRLAKKREEENHLLTEVARSTSAAPTYFEPNLIQDTQNENLVLIDGGVLANNPAVLAYAEAKEIYKVRQKTEKEKLEKEKLEKGFEAEVEPFDDDFPFYMLSIGTGKIQKQLDISHVQTWQTKDWLEPLLQDIFMNSVSETNEYVMEHLLPHYEDGTPRYQRLNIPIPSELAELDNTDNIEGLLKLADAYIEANKPLLLNICKTLTQ